MSSSFEADYAQSVFDRAMVAHTRRWRSVLAVNVRFADGGDADLDSQYIELEGLCSKFTAKLVRKLETVGEEALEYLSTLQHVDGIFAFFFVTQPPIGIHESIFKKMIFDSWDHCLDQIDHFAFNNEATPARAAHVGSAR